MRPPSSTPLPDGLIWRGSTIHIETTVSGRRISRSCRTASIPEAKRLLDILRGQMHTAQLTGIEAPASRPRVDLGEFINDELSALQGDGGSPKTLVKYRGIMRFFIDFLRQRLGHAPWVHEVDPALVEAFKVHASSTLRQRNGARQGIGRQVSPRTVANELDTIRVFLRKAVKRGLLKTNPETGVTRARGAYAPRIRWLIDDEIERLLAAAASWDTWAHANGRSVGSLYATIIEFYLRTGMRLNELRHLPLSHCQGRDPSGRRVLNIGPHAGPTTFCFAANAEIAKQVRQTGTAAVSRMLIAPEVNDADCAHLQHVPELNVAVVPISCAWKPKSRARDIPLSQRGEQLFKQLVERRRELLIREPALAEARKRIRAGEPPWLIPDPSGVPWRFSLQYIMDRCSQQAGISPIVRTHDLRHTFATQLRQRGVPIETLKELLGHADITETLIYAHFTLAEAVKSIDLIDAVAPRS